MQPNKIQSGNREISNEERQLIENLMDHTFPRKMEWNEIMPVVQKIESLDFIVHLTKECAWIEKDQVKMEVVIYVQSKDRLESTYKSVLDFIHWYNTNK